MLSLNCVICGKKKSTFIKNQDLSNDKFKMNKIINKFLLTGDKFMQEFHPRQPGFNYSAYGPFTKHHKRIQKFRETDNLKHLYRNKLDKACFVHDAAYSDSNDLAKRTISEKILKDRAYEIARHGEYDGYQRALASIV